VRRAVLITAAASGLWACWLLGGGGFTLLTPVGPLRSYDPSRPIALSVSLALWYYWRWRPHWPRDVGRAAHLDWPKGIAGAASVATLTLGLVWGNPLATGPDASGYVSQADLWISGTLTRPVPAWARDAPWGDAAFTAAPVGYRTGHEPGTIVPFYSAGYPLVMAVGRLVGGSRAMFLVVPILGALTVWLTYLLGCMVGGSWCGAIAGLLLLSSPAFLIMQMTAMSDGPVAAWWTLAVYASLRATTGGAVVGGLAAALAILTRPNTLPLAAVVVLLICAQGPLRARRSVWFAALAALGVAFTGVLNWQWYGSPLRSAYGVLSDIYALDRVWPNALNYARWLWETETPLVALACGAPWAFRRAGLSRTAATLLAVAFPLTVVSLYLPYRVWQEWVYLRFLLPAYPVVLVGVAAVLVRTTSSHRNGPLRVASVVVAIAAFAYHGFHEDRTWRGVAAAEQRYARVLDYVTALPERSVFISLNHSGTIHYYTGRNVLRWEAMGRDDLDGAVTYLRNDGYGVYLVADDSEVEPFRDYFASASVARDLHGTARRELGQVSVYALQGTLKRP
jgi:hypothetical protein